MLDFSLYKASVRHTKYARKCISPGWIDLGRSNLEPEGQAVVTLVWKNVTRGITPLNYVDIRF